MSCDYENSLNKYVKLDFFLLQVLPEINYDTFR